MSRDRNTEARPEMFCAADVIRVMMREYYLSHSTPLCHEPIDKYIELVLFFFVRRRWIDELIVIDPASPYEEEQNELDVFVDGLMAEGRRVREIILTHHHPDHIGGAEHLRSRLGVPVAAHRLTADRVKYAIEVDRLVEDNELIELDGDPGWRLRALHTPG